MGIGFLDQTNDHAKLELEPFQYIVLEFSLSSPSLQILRLNHDQLEFRILIFHHFFCYDAANS